MSPRSCTGSDRRVEYDEGSNRTSHSSGTYALGVCTLCDTP